MKIVWQLFITFFKIGAFTLGGGYAMLSMVEKAVVDQKTRIPRDDANGGYRLLIRTPKAPVSLTATMIKSFTGAALPRTS